MTGLFQMPLWRRPFVWSRAGTRRFVGGQRCLERVLTVATLLFGKRTVCSRACPVRGCLGTTKSCIAVCGNRVRLACDLTRCSGLPCFRNSRFAAKRVVFGKGQCPKLSLRLSLRGSRLYTLAPSDRCDVVVGGRKVRRIGLRGAAFVCFHPAGGASLGGKFCRLLRSKGQLELLTQGACSITRVGMRGVTGAHGRRARCFVCKMGCCLRCGKVCCPIDGGGSFTGVFPRRRGLVGHCTQGRGLGFHRSTSTSLVTLAGFYRRLVSRGRAQ